MRILLDGWALIHEPASPAALHLAAVLSTLPESVEAVLALPGTDPEMEGLPVGLETRVQQTPNTAWGLLAWQQSRLPRQAGQSNSACIYTAAPGAALWGKTTTAACPSGWRVPGFKPAVTNPSNSGGKSLGRRIQEAAGLGGLSRIGAVFLPQDLPAPKTSLPVVQVPPLIHPAFQAHQPAPAIEFWPGVELPQTYIVYHGPLDRPAILRLLEAWSWCAASIGAYYPLLVYGAAASEREQLLATTRQAGLSDSLVVLPAGNPVQLAALYFGCSVLFQPGPVSPWGDPLQHALACGKPVVAAASPWSEARLGDAGYLVNSGDLRALGAALISVIVEEDLAEELAKRARRRSETWNPSGHWQAILKAIQDQRMRDNKPT